MCSATVCMKTALATACATGPAAPVAVAGAAAIDLPMYLASRETPRVEGRRRIAKGVFCAPLLTALIMTSGLVAPSGLHAAIIEEQASLPDNGGRLGITFLPATMSINGGMVFAATVSNFLDGSKFKDSTLSKDDKIVSFQGQYFKTQKAFTQYIAANPPGLPVEIGVIDAATGREKYLTRPLASRDDLRQVEVALATAPVGTASSPAISAASADAPIDCEADAVRARKRADIASQRSQEVNKIVIPAATGVGCGVLLWLAAVDGGATAGFCTLVSGLSYLAVPDTVYADVAFDAYVESRDPRCVTKRSN